MRTRKQIDRLMASFFASGEAWGKHPDLTDQEFSLWLTVPGAKAAPKIVLTYVKDIA